MTRARPYLLAALAVLLVLVLAQVLLPRIAAARIRARLSRYGSVESVSVSAFPAIKLLWGSVDSVHVRARELSLSTGGAESLLWEAHDISTLDFSAASVDVGRLRLGPASLSKHGSQLEAEASASASEIAAALPGGVAVQLVGGGEGKVEVRVSGSLFGLGTSLNAVATASEGRLVVRPLGLLSALQLTLLDDPHVHVEGVDARVESSDPLTYRLSMRALLR